MERKAGFPSKDNWYLEILLGLFCGLRKGEIYGLKFSDFDLENHSVKISRQIVANPIIEGSRIEENVSIERDPKTPNSFRVLRVPEVIITELEKRKCLIEIYKEKMQENFVDNDYISCQANGKVHSLSAMNKMTEIKRSHIQSLYNEEAAASVSIARLVKTVMNTSM